MKIRILIGIITLGVFAMLLYSVMDGAVSLDHARSQNEVLQRKCKLLALLSDDGLRQRSVESVKRLVGPETIIKEEGDELWLDDVALKIQNGHIKNVNLVSTCQ